MSRRIRRRRRTSSGVSTKILMSSTSRSDGSTNTRMPSSTITGVGDTERASFFRVCDAKS
jgi:hypothetical protein